MVDRASNVSIADSDDRSARFEAAFRNAGFPIDCGPAEELSLASRSAPPKSIATRPPWSGFKSQMGPGGEGTPHVARLRAVNLVFQLHPDSPLERILGAVDVPMTKSSRENLVQHSRADETMLLANARFGERSCRTSSTPCAAMECFTQTLRQSPRNRRATSSSIEAIVELIDAGVRKNDRNRTMAKPYL